MLIARLEIFFADRVGRKILVSFHFHGLIAFGEDCAFPRCFCHDARLDSYKGSRLQISKAIQDTMTEAITEARFNGHSMVGSLQRVLVWLVAASSAIVLIG